MVGLTWHGPKTLLAKAIGRRGGRFVLQHQRVRISWRCSWALAQGRRGRDMFDQGAQKMFRASSSLDEIERGWAAVAVSVSGAGGNDETRNRP